MNHSPTRREEPTIGDAWMRGDAAYRADEQFMLTSRRTTRTAALLRSIVTGDDPEANPLFMEMGKYDADRAELIRQQIHGGQ